MVCQVIKAGIGTKGPTLTTYLSIPGRFVVMMPGMSRLGVSRKIEDEDERLKLRKMLDDYTSDASRPHQEYAAELLAAYQRLESHVAATLSFAEGNIRDGKTKLAREQLDALERMLGQPRPKIDRLRGLLPEVVERWRRPKHAKIEPQTRRFAYDPDQPPTYDWEFIVPFAAETKDSQNETYYVHKLKDGEADEPQSWHQSEFQPSGWRPHQGAVVAQRGDQILLRRTFQTVANPAAYKFLQIVARGARGVVYVNGFKMADVRQGELYLRPGITGVLKKDGPNVLAARLTADGTVDIGIKAGPPIIPNLDDVLDGF